MHRLSEKEVADISRTISNVKKEISKVIVGQEEVIDNLLKAIIANGHVSLEGLPGIAKTLIVKTLAKTLDCKFSRIQFTVDLLPADIIGFTAYNEKRGFHTVKGPLFANFVIADEINRGTPKVQSALLEAMAERQITIGNQTFKLPDPFFVIATNNPIESEGVYPLPEAQKDRFIFKLFIDYPEFDDEIKILNNNETLKRFDEFKINKTLTQNNILKLQRQAKMVYTNDNINKYIIRLVEATRNYEKYKIKLGKYIEWGSSPRASISLFIGSKIEAMIRGRNYVTPQDVKNVAKPVLRHRIILNYEGQAEGIKTDDIISEILDRVPIK